MIMLDDDDDANADADNDDDDELVLNRFFFYLIYEQKQ